MDKKFRQPAARREASRAAAAMKGYSQARGHREWSSSIPLRCSSWLVCSVCGTDLVSATILLPLTFCGLCGSHGWPRVTMCLEFADVVQPVHACPCLVTPPVVPDASDSQSISAYTIWPAMPNVDQHFSFIFFLLVALATKHKPSIRFKRWYTDRTRWVKNGLSSLLPPGALHIYCWTNKRLNQIIVYRLTNNNLLSHYSTTSTIYQFINGRYELVNPDETSSVGITSWHVYFYRHWKR